MNTPTHLKLNNIAKGLAGFVFTALLAMTAATAQVASGTTGIDATGNASSEMAACNNGTTQQDRATCMTEVKNANAAKRAGQIDNAGGQFKANALKRCDVLSGEDKVACQARIVGYGETKGSVAGGGVIREVETVVLPKNESNVVIQPQTRSDAIIVIPAQR
jgi:hypothetical protein